MLFTVFTGHNSSKVFTAVPFLSYSLFGQFRIPGSRGCCRTPSILGTFSLFPVGLPIRSSSLASSSKLSGFVRYYKVNLSTTSFGSRKISISTGPKKPMTSGHRRPCLCENSLYNVLFVVINSQIRSYSIFFYSVVFWRRAAACFARPVVSRVRLIWQHNAIAVAIESCLLGENRTQKNIARQIQRTDRRYRVHGRLTAVTPLYCCTPVRYGRAQHYYTVAVTVVLFSIYIFFFFH